MSFLSLSPIASTLANTTLNAVGVNTIAGSGTSTGASSLDLDGALASLAQALAVPPISTPELSGLSSVVTSVLDVVDAGIGLDVGLGTPGAPLIDLGVSLGSGGSVIDFGAEVLNPNAGGSLLNVDLDLGSTTGTASPGIDPSAGTPTGAEPVAAPVESVAELPDLTDLLDNVVDAIGLGNLPGVDVGLELGGGGSATPVVDVDAGIGGGSTSLPSTDAPATPSTGGTPIPTGSGGSPTPSTTSIPSVHSTSTTDGLPSIGEATSPTVPGGVSGTGSTGGNGWSSPTVDMDGVGSVAGGNGSDTVMGLGGNDTVYGYGGNDIVLGNQNNDRVYGGDGDDLCHGGRDDDYVNGEDGDDRIWGDFGDDTLEGGDGADTFYFTLNSGNDIILDFNHAEGDRFDFQGQTFAVADVGGNAVITLSGGGAVVLAGVTGAEFNSYGFV